MKVFLSWSGKRAQEAARAFRFWLPDVLQRVEPWMSSEDIDSGAGWNQEIRNALDSSDFGIIFVTRDNMKSDWLMFEAGAISKHVEDAKVVPLVVDADLKPAMLTGPLSQLQIREANREEIERLVRDLNRDCPIKLKPESLDRCFRAHWPRLEERLGDLPKPEGDKPALDEKAVLAEILEKVRAVSSSRGNDKWVSINLSALNPGLIDFAISRFENHDFDEQSVLSIKEHDFHIRIWKNGQAEISKV